MVIAHFTPGEFFKYLKNKGCKQLDEYTDKYANVNMVIYEKNGITAPVLIRKQYYPSYVCMICESFDIEPPADFVKIREQLRVLNRKK
jgi:hypothetical protein